MSLELPKIISPNGEELWDLAGRLSRYIHLNDDRRRLRLKLNKLPRECGSCRFWMTRDCPCETPSMTGYSRGPSMSAPICTKFVMSHSSNKLQREWEAELLTIETALAAPSTARKERT